MSTRILRTATLAVLLFQAAVSFAQSPWNAPGGYLNMDPSDIFFADTDNGWAVGDYGKIAATTDGGAHWSFRESPTTQPFFCTWFVSATDGFAAGSSGLFVSTTDGGETWTQHAPLTADGLYAMQFVSATEGWVAGDVSILHTTDGGDTWTTQYTNNDVSIQSLHFVSATHGWAVGNEWGNPNGLILATTDGGATWTPQASGVAQSLNAVFFTSASNGVIAGWNGTILTTTDGGANWSSAASGPYGMLNDVHFTSATDGVITGDNGHILVTTDGGTTWTPQNLSFNQVDLRTAFFLDATHGWICGEGCILNTANGGTSWDFQYAGTGFDLYEVDFFSPNNGLAVGIYGKILRSTDYGASWELQHVVSSSWFFDVDMASDDVAWVCGNNGTIRSTTDGGTTWSAQFSGTTEELLGMCFVSEQEGWVVGNNTILATTDGGATWIDQNPGLTGVMRDVDFVSATEGWIVGDDGLLLKTTDAGTTWTPQTLPSPAYLRAVRFISQDEGWIAGFGGTVYHTTDAGASWELQYTGTNMLFHTIRFISPDQGWAAGAGGIYVTSNGGDTWMAQHLEWAEFNGLYVSPAGDAGIAVGTTGMVKVYSCSEVGLEPNVYVLPSTDTTCTGILQLSVTGSGSFASSIDGATAVVHGGDAVFTGLCAGEHTLAISDVCGNADTLLFIVPSDSTNLVNDPFGNSIGLDSIGAIVENCFVMYSSIDTAFIDSIWASGDTVTVIWNITDGNGPHLDTAVYLLAGGNGLYWLQLSAFCPTKALGDYFVVSQAVFFENGSVSTAGVAEQEENAVLLWPNPTSGVLFLSSASPITAVTILDLQGRTVARFSGDALVQADLGQLAAGNYAAVIEGQAGRVVKQLVVTR